MSWATLFERAASAGPVGVDDVTRALTDRRGRTETTDEASGEEATPPDTADPGPARVVADADVLAADLLVGGDARDALDGVRAHSWVILVASDALVADAEAVVATLTDRELAADWRDRAEGLRASVAHPAGDHPALASAYRGGAMHVLTFDEDLRSAGAGAAIREHVETSVKHPRAFARLFDPRSLYAAVEDGEYPGPDRDPRG